MSNNKQKYHTVGELIYWSYANLAMAHEAVANSKDKYDRTSFIIRNRMYHGFLKGTMKFGSMMDDEKVKIRYTSVCAYCGESKDISIDHIIPRLKGGNESADNLIRVCKHCNSSKGAKDMLTWHIERGEMPSILIMRRYLKLVFNYCCENNLLDIAIEDIDKATLPFDLKNIITEFPTPDKLMLYK